MDKLAVVVKAILEFLQKVMPGLILAFSAGYKMAAKQTSKVQALANTLALKLKYKENEIEIMDKLSKKSDADIIADAIKSTSSEPPQPGSDE